jgi:hypothetical protein
MNLSRRCFVAVACVVVLESASPCARADAIPIDPGGSAGILPTPRPVYSIETDRDTYQLGQVVHAVHRVANDGDADFTMEILQTPGFDLHVLAEDGGKVWSAHRAFALNVWYLTLGPGESVERNYAWDMIDEFGAPVAPGEYQIVGVIYGTGGSVATSITIMPEPASLLVGISGFFFVLGRGRRTSRQSG